MDLYQREGLREREKKGVYGREGKEKRGGDRKGGEEV